MKSKTKKIIIFLQIIIIVFLAIPVFLHNYAFFFVIVSNSMNPEIYKNDLVLVRGAQKDVSAYVGKTIAFYNPFSSSITVHRALEEQDEYLMTKGDNSDFPDFYRVPQERLIGEVVFILPLGEFFKTIDK